MGSPIVILSFDYDLDVHDWKSLIKPTAEVDKQMSVTKD